MLFITYKPEYCIQKVQYKLQSRVIYSEMSLSVLHALGLAQF